MGSLFKPSVPAAPPPPPEPEVMDFRSEVTGVERIAVKDEDGKTTIVEKLVLTPEQIEAQNKLKEIATEQLQRIEDLTNNFDVDMIPGLSETLKTFNETQAQGLKTAFNVRTRSEETALGQFGQSDSTAAAIQRNMRERDKGLAAKNIENETELLKQDIRTRELGMAQNLLGVVSDRQDTQLAQYSDTLNRGQAGSQYMTGLLANRNNLLYQGGLQQQQLGFQQSQAMMNNIAATAGMATLLAGPAGFKWIGGGDKAAGAAAGAAASDLHLKHNVTYLGTTKGLPLYSYSYIGHPANEVHIGVLAQDMEEILPESVIEMPNGYLAVDYGVVTEHLNGSLH